MVKFISRFNRRRRHNILKSLLGQRRRLKCDINFSIQDKLVVKEIAQIGVVYRTRTV